MYKNIDTSVPDYKRPLQFKIVEAQKKEKPKPSEIFEMPKKPKHKKVPNKTNKRVKKKK